MAPGGLRHTSLMLRHLILNFAAITPELAGGVATVCQGMATHIPAGLSGVATSVLIGPGNWEARHPLPKSTLPLSIRGLSARKAGIRVDRSLRQNDRPGLKGLLGSLPVALGIKPPFSGHHAEGTVVHCPYQVVHPLPPKAWHLPYVINLHDIQHEHLPDFFSPKELAWRREAYLASAQHAAAVCVVDEWTRRDVLAHLPIEASKVFVAPFGPTWAKPAPLTPERAKELTQSYGLPGRFLFYPAQTWPHKNHGRLLEALALLHRDKGLAVPLICTGHLNEHHPRLVKQAADLGLAERVHFLGLVPADDIQALYQMAVGVVIPTLRGGGHGTPRPES